MPLSEEKIALVANLRPVLNILIAAKDIIDATPCPGRELIIMDMEDAITSVNQELLEALRLEPGEISGI